VRRERKTGGKARRDEKNPQSLHSLPAAFPTGFTQGEEVLANQEFLNADFVPKSTEG
jgi:hypothetical protein